MNARMSSGKIILVAMIFGWLLLPQVVAAHCDALDGPVVVDARRAMETGNVAAVLKWVMPEHETAIRNAFAHTMKVRELGPEARELADLYFFETLVRMHRESEGAPYTGLKPAGTIDPPIAKADRALEDGSVDELADAISAHVGKALRERFAHALEKKQKSDTSVEAGREFVDAYVEYVHFVEGIVGVVHGDHAH